MVSLGLIAAFTLPPEIKAAYGVETAQQLADQIGVSKRPTIWMRAEARRPTKHCSAAITRPR